MRFIWLILFVTFLALYNHDVNAKEHNYDINDLLVAENIDDQTILAYTLFHENRSESDLSNMMVLATIYNRVNSDKFPNTVREVVTQKHQFSFLFDGKSDRIVNKEVYNHLYSLVELFLLNKELFLGLSEGSMYYHTENVYPVWRKSFRRVGQFDSHIFYRE